MDGLIEKDSRLPGAYVTLEQLLALRFLPNPVALRAQNARIVGNRAGSKLSKLKGRGVDLAEVRAYQPGDDAVADATRTARDYIESDAENAAQDEEAA